MKLLLRLEALALFLLGIAGLYYQPLHVNPWLWPLLILAPDLSMLGYLGGPRIGAVSYNIAHHKAVAISLTAIGFHAGSPIVQFIGILLFTHSAMDRVLGYGLKYPDDFKHTHLGRLPAGKRQ